MPFSATVLILTCRPAARTAAIKRYEESWASGTYADLEWKSLVRMLDRHGADYRQ